MHQLWNNRGDQTYQAILENKPLGVYRDGLQPVYEGKESHNPCPQNGKRLLKDG